MTIFDPVELRDDELIYNQGTAEGIDDPDVNAAKAIEFFSSRKAANEISDAISYFFVDRSKLLSDSPKEKADHGPLPS